MKEQLISFGIAKLAKEKGFQSYTSFYYSEGMEIKGTKMGMYGNPNAYGGISAPTQSLLQKWLREVHFIEVQSKLNSGLYRELFEQGRNKKCLNYHHVITTGINNKEFLFETFSGRDTFETYEEALEKGLQEALKLI